MNTYKAMYRCRLCGKAFYSGSEKDEQTARGYMNIIIAGLTKSTFLRRLCFISTIAESHITA